MQHNQPFERTRCNDDVFPAMSVPRAAQGRRWANWGNKSKILRAVVITSVFAVGCASFGADPYPGSGGLYFGTPSRADIASGRAVFDEAKFSSFQIGVTTKRQVVEKLGEPANWTTKPDGTSQLGYNYVQKEQVMYRQVKEARFTFDKNLVLTEMRLPTFGVQ